MCSSDLCARDLSDRHVTPMLSVGAQTGGFRLTYPADGSERTLELLGRADPVPAPPGDLLSATTAVLVGPILCEVSADLVRRVRQASAAPLFLDPQGMLRASNSRRIVGRIQDGLLDVLPLCDVVKPNEHEATLLTGIDATARPIDAVRRLHAMGVPIAVVTLAERGSVVFDGRRLARIPPFAVDAVDPTGAGDTFMAGFIHDFLQSRDPVRACLFGSAVASVMVQNIGPDFPLTPAEAARRFATLHAEVAGA